MTNRIFSHSAMTKFDVDKLQNAVFAKFFVDITSARKYNDSKTSDNCISSLFTTKNGLFAIKYLICFGPHAE
jgi:hypothetical protein